MRKGKLVGTTRTAISLPVTEKLLTLIGWLWGASGITREGVRDELVADGTPAQAGSTVAPGELWKGFGR